MMTAQLKRVQDIQILRAVASLMVIFYHLSLTFTLFDYMPRRLTVPLYLGVELFFVISGYVVTGSVFSRGPNAAAFLIRRTFRLTPAIVTFLLFSLIVFTFVQTLPDQTTVRNLGMAGATSFLLQSVAILFGVLINYFRQTLYYFGAMWSLSVEYQFYAAYAALLGVLTLARLSHQQIKRCLLGVCSLLLLATYATRLELLNEPIFGQSVRMLLRYLGLWRFDFILLGVILALLVDRYGALKLPRRGLVIAIGLAVLAFVLVVGTACEGPLAAVKPRHDHVLLPIASVGFTLLVALASGRSPGVSDHNGVYRAFVWLGNRSYSMYLYHFPVMALVWWAISVMAPWVFQHDPLLYGGAQAVATLAVTTLLADATYRYVEVPWGRMGERLSDRWAGPREPMHQKAATFNAWEGRSSTIRAGQSSSGIAPAEAAGNQPPA